VSGASLYELQMKTGSGQWRDVDVSEFTNDTTANVTGLAANTPYEFQVRAKNFGGESDWSSALTQATITALAKPTNLTATPTGNGAKLTWDTVNGAAAYKIYRSADGGKTFILVSTRLAKNFNGKTPYFNDTSAESGSFIYAIRAYDSSLSNTTRSDEVTATVTV
jgi:hypothetical protein